MDISTAEVVIRFMLSFCGRASNKTLLVEHVFTILMCNYVLLTGFTLILQKECIQHVSQLCFEMYWQMGRERGGLPVSSSFEYGCSLE